MKAHAPTLGLVELVAPRRSDGEVVRHHERVATPAAAPPRARSAARGHTRRAVSIVTLLAFGQSMVFLVAWLFLCAMAGAETTTNQVSGFAPALVKSTYTVTTPRDPFTVRKVMVAAAGEAGVLSELVLRGIVQHPTRPAAMVNDAVLELNETATVHTHRGPIDVKAVQITRDRVVLEAGGEKIELRIDTDSPPAAGVNAPAPPLAGPNTAPSAAGNHQ
jgi:hypothetical protein